MEPFLFREGSGPLLVSMPHVGLHIPDDSAAGMTGVMTGVTDFTLGGQPSGASPYRGIMDDVRLYNTALTAEQIAELMLGNTKLAGTTRRASGESKIDTSRIPDASPT